MTENVRLAVRQYGINFATDSPVKLAKMIDASLGSVTKNRANLSVAYLFFVLKLRLKRSLYRGWLVSVSSPLVFVVSAAGNRDTDGSWAILFSTLSSSDNTKHIINRWNTRLYGTVPEKNHHELTQDWVFPSITGDPKIDICWCPVAWMMSKEEFPEYRSKTRRLEWAIWYI